MEQKDVVGIAHELLMASLLLVTPAVVASLVVGLLVSIFQTVTSIQEQTLSFAPRIVAVGLVIAVTLPWSLQVAIEFTYNMLMRISEVSV